MLMNARRNWPLVLAAFALFALAMSGFLGAGCLAAEEETGDETGSLTGDDTGDETGDATGDETGVDTIDTDDGTPSFGTLYTDYLEDCSGCHALDDASGAVVGAGATDDIETSLDFKDRDAAYSTLVYGNAAGLIGNQEGCNDVPFIGATANQSLLMAVLDEDVRFAFDIPSAPDCNLDSISDMALRTGFEPGEQYLNDLAAWIDAGAPDN